MGKDYYFSDFTETNYREILKSLKEKYNCIKFRIDEIRDCKIHRKALWRHDVDFSLNRAFALSCIEYEEGIQSTYFLHMHSQMYNLFEKEQSGIVFKLLSNGHDIGLHFDFDYYKIRLNQNFEKAAEIERKMLEDVFEVKINAISFHNPESNNVLDIQTETYAGMVNAYSNYIKENFIYCSDSNGYWRFDRLSNVIDDYPENIHILTHPAWWTPSVMTPYERIQRCVCGRKDAIIKSYNMALERDDRENVGFIADKE